MGDFILERALMEKSEIEASVLSAVCEEAKRTGDVTEANLTRLRETFGTRLLKAWETVRDDRVKKYTFRPSGRVVWIVVGRERDYLVMPAADFCSCDDFYFKVMEKKAHMCYHLIAQKLAECVGRYDRIEEEDSFYDVLIKEWKRVTT